MDFFDDSRLDDPEALGAADWHLRRIASAGARVRIEGEAAEQLLGRGGIDPERPRAVLAIGPEARLIRAVLEPTCPVPFLAWPSHALPAWVGALDVVVALAPTGGDAAMLASVVEAVRRGCRVVLAAPADSEVAGVVGRRGMVVPVSTGDAQPAVIAALLVLHHLRLGPSLSAERVAATLDEIAEECAPRVDVAHNPAKDLALGLAEAQPLVWGGSVLAARASRRVSEALRISSGRPTLAGEAEDLLPIIEGAPARDPFADPDDPQDRRPTLVILDDDQADEASRVDEDALRRAADAHDVRVCVVRMDAGGIVDRYAGLQARGVWAAAYLGIGLGRTPAE